MISPIKDMDTISESLLIDGKLDLKMRTAQQCLQKKTKKKTITTTK